MIFVWWYLTKGKKPKKRKYRGSSTYATQGYMDVSKAFYCDSCGYKTIQIANYDEITQTCPGCGLYAISRTR